MNPTKSIHLPFESPQEYTLFPWRVFILSLHHHLLINLYWFSFFFLCTINYITTFIYRVLQYKPYSNYEMTLTIGCLKNLINSCRSWFSLSGTILNPSIFRKILQWIKFEFYSKSTRKESERAQKENLNSILSIWLSIGPSQSVNSIGCLSTDWATFILCSVQSTGFSKSFFPPTWLDLLWSSSPLENKIISQQQQASLFEGNISVQYARYSSQLKFCSSNQ